MIVTRRHFLTGLLAAPIVCGSGVLMPVKRVELGDGVALFSISHPIMPIWTEQWSYDGSYWYDGTKIAPGVLTRSVLNRPVYEGGEFGCLTLRMPA